MMDVVIRTYDKLPPRRLLVNGSDNFRIDVRDQYSRECLNASTLSEFLVAVAEPHAKKVWVDRARGVIESVLEDIDADAKLLVVMFKFLVLGMPLIERNVDDFIRHAMNEREYVNVIADPRLTFDWLDAIEW